MSKLVIDNSIYYASVENEDEAKSKIVEDIFINTKKYGLVNVMDELCSEGKPEIGDVLIYSCDIPVYANNTYKDLNLQYNKVLKAAMEKNKFKDIALFGVKNFEYKGDDSPYISYALVIDESYIDFGSPIYSYGKEKKKVYFEAVMNGCNCSKTEEVDNFVGRVYYKSRRFEEISLDFKVFDGCDIMQNSFMATKEWFSKYEKASLEGNIEEMQKCQEGFEDIRAEYMSKFNKLLGVDVDIIQNMIEGYKYKDTDFIIIGDYLREIRIIFMRYINPID